MWVNFSIKEGSFQQENVGNISYSQFDILNPDGIKIFLLVYNLYILQFREVMQVLRMQKIVLLNTAHLWIKPNVCL